MGKIVSAILGGGKTSVSRAPIEDTEAMKRKSAQSRSALFETQGGIDGAELSPEDVERRKTLLGN